MHGKKNQTELTGAEGRCDYNKKLLVSSLHLLCTVHSWVASLVPQSVKNPSAMQGQEFNPLGGEDPLEEGLTSHSSMLAWRLPMDRGAWWAAVPESDTAELRSTVHNALG